MFYIRGLQKYNFYNQFFQDEDKERIIDFYIGYCKCIHQYNLYIDYEYDVEYMEHIINNIFWSLKITKIYY